MGRLRPTIPTDIVNGERTGKGKERRLRTLVGCEPESVSCGRPSDRAFQTLPEHCSARTHLRGPQNRKLPAGGNDAGTWSVCLLNARASSAVGE